MGGKIHFFIFNLLLSMSIAEKILLLRVKYPWNYMHSNLNIMKHFVLWAWLINDLLHGIVAHGWS